MKKTAIMMMVAALVAGIAGAAEVSVSADFASAYVFRGATFNDGLVFQPGMEAAGFPIPEEYGSLAIGTWANFDINDVGAGNEFTEIDYYLSYSLPVSVVDLGVGYCEYTYPSGGSADREMSLSVGKGIGESGFYTSLAFNYGLDGAIDGSTYIQGGLDYGVDLSDALSMSAGVTAAYAMNDGGEDGFNDATATVGLSYALSESWAINSSLTYVAQLDDKVLTDDAYDVGLLGMIGLSCDF